MRAVIFFTPKSRSFLKNPVWDVRWHVSLAAGSLRLLLCYVCIVLFCLPPCCRGACLWLCLACHCDTGTRADKFYFAVPVLRGETESVSVALVGAVGAPRLVLWDARQGRGAQCAARRSDLFRGSGRAMRTLHFSEACGGMDVLVAATLVRELTHVRLPGSRARICPC